AEHPHARALDLLVEHVNVCVHAVDRVLRRQLLAVDHVHGQQILRHRGSSLACRIGTVPTLYHSYERRPAEIDTLMDLVPTVTKGADPMTTTDSPVTGVDFVSVPTQDLDRATDFYENVVGLEPGPRW